MSTIASRAVVEGPIIKNKASFYYHIEEHLQTPGSKNYRDTSLKVEMVKEKPLTISAILMVSSASG